MRRKGGNPKIVGKNFIYCVDYWGGDLGTEDLGVSKGWLNDGFKPGVKFVGNEN